MRVVTVEQMRAIERRAESEHGLTSPVLMEHAGRSVAELLRAALGGAVNDRRVLILVGPGNNGGDGRVMGRYLAEWGAEVTFYAWKERRLEAGNRLIPVGDDLAAVRDAVARADVVADALLGTGNARPLEASMRRLLALVRDEKARRPALYVLAVDLPTGLNADTGAVDEGAIPCDLTVTLAFPKLGLLLYPGSNDVGPLQVGGIGLPPEMSIAAELDLLDAASVRPLLPARPADSNKGTFGKVMILAGSAHYIGAAYLVTAAAARIGAGLVTLATTAERAPLYASMLPEATYHLLPAESADPVERARTILDGLADYRALVVGPGLGQSDATRGLLDALFAGLKTQAERPRLLVDADGLNMLARIERWWERLPAGTVITPHPGEMARLRGGANVSGGGPDRLPVAREAARAWNLVVALKGANTFITEPDGGTRMSWPGNAALATGGTGDVLAGTIGGLLAQGLDPYAAASAGVYVHSQAGFLVSGRIGDAGLLAGDLLDALPLALKEIKQAR